MLCQTFRSFGSFWAILGHFWAILALLIYKGICPDMPSGPYTPSRVILDSSGTAQPISKFLVFLESRDQGLSNGI